MDFAFGLGSYWRSNESNYSYHHWRFRGTSCQVTQAGCGSASASLAVAVTTLPSLPSVITPPVQYVQVLRVMCFR